MGENFFKGILFSVILITLIFFFGTIIKYDVSENQNFISDKEENSITGYAVHRVYSNFNQPETARVQKNKIYVEDDIIFKAGWYSVNGSAWKIFYFLGDFYEGSSAWIRGSASASLPYFGEGEHYVIVYSCSRNESWDCRNNKWQLIIINNTGSSFNYNQTVTTDTDSQENQYLQDNYSYEIDVDSYQNNTINTSQNSSNQSSNVAINQTPSATETCYDGIKNQNEVFTDCGGRCILCECLANQVRSCPIENGVGYQSAVCTDGRLGSWSSCVWSNCNAGYHREGNFCVGDVPTYSCADGIKNGDEVFTDCGGSCVLCECLANQVRTCNIENGVGYQSAVCTDGRLGSWSSCVWSNCNAGYHREGNFCVVDVPTYSCTDGIRNGDETGVDCGGSCSVCASVNYQRVFYVSADGSDSNSGLSVSAPWRTLAHVNRQMFRAGDAILFRRGDTWYGSLNVSNSGTSSAPITFGAYGSGNKPVISGFTTVSGWISNGGGTYYKQVSVQSSPLVVTVNGKNAPKGRWPNTGWLLLDSYSGYTSITDSDLNGRTFTNGEIVIRVAKWVTYRARITSHSGSTINFPWVLNNNYALKYGQGYFIQNDVDTFDIIGDWAYVNGNLYMYFGSNSPSNYEVKVSTIDSFTSLDSKEYITFDNLYLEGYNYQAIGVKNSRHITVTNCEFEKMGNFGIYGPSGGDSSYLKVENCEFIDNNNCGISLYGSHKYATIRYNYLKNIGMIDGLAGYEDGSAIGIQATGTNAIIAYNNLEYIGYNGMCFGGSSGGNSKVHHNFINNYCQRKDDCGGIYTGEEGSVNNEITDNILMNSINHNEGIDGYLPDGLHEQVYHGDYHSHGIYIDDPNDIDIYRNTVINNEGSGIFLNTQALNIDVQNNTLFNNVFGVQIISNVSRRGEITGLVMRNNIIVAKELNQYILYYATGSDDSGVRRLGYVDYNYYARPLADTNIIKTNIKIWNGPPAVYRTLEGWRTYSGYDSNSRKSPKSVSTTNDLRFEYNYGSSSKTINLGGNYIDVKGTVYSGSITLQPYTSVVLIKN